MRAAMLLLVIAGIALPQVEGAEARSRNDAPFAIPTFHCLGIYNGRMPQGQEAHGVRGVPVYAANTGFDPVTKTGRFQLAPDSPGAGAAQIVPNFSDGYAGPAPDICHDQASSLIECNRFDWNRHSIAGTGRPGCSYVARNNVELGESLSHCFDMHGGRDRKDGTDIAGTSIEISHNTFRAPQTAVVIRGVPEKQCNVHHNWFTRHAPPQPAVHAGAKTSVTANAYGAEARIN